MFLPVKADFGLPRVPYLTILVCLVCALVFLKQQSDWAEYEVALDRFCTTDRSYIDLIIFEIGNRCSVSVTRPTILAGC